MEHINDRKEEDIIVLQPSEFPSPQQLSFKLHDFKMGLALVAKQRYTDFAVTVWAIPTLRRCWADNNMVENCITYHGFKFILSKIEADTDEKYYSFNLTYCNDDVGMIQYRTNDFIREESNKSSKRKVNYPDDYDSVIVQIRDK
jgi:hypothetical protein